MIWVAVLNISDRTAEKLAAVHGIAVDEVRLALVAVPGLAFTWHDHPERGLRAIVKARIRRLDALFVLYPVDDPMGDVWNLGSAYWVD